MKPQYVSGTINKDVYLHTDATTIKRISNLETEVGNLESSKQDVLTVGDNITISDNVISAIIQPNTIICTLEGDYTQRLPITIGEIYTLYQQGLLRTIRTSEGVSGVAPVNLDISQMTLSDGVYKMRVFGVGDYDGNQQGFWVFSESIGEFQESDTVLGEMTIDIVQMYATLK